jgi:type IV pilus assembly protein PilO
MATSNPHIDINAWFSEASQQFQGLDLNEPGRWPLLPKIIAFIATAVVVVFLGWSLILSDRATELEALHAQEDTLKQDVVKKLSQAANLAELQKQRVQVQEYVTQLEKQLPGKAEMDALLTDINQAGIGRGLEFQLFKPGDVVVKDYYAELPIAVKVTGSYNDMGAFAADISKLSRIVTLHDLQIRQASAKGNAGPLEMEAIARTYRYLDPEEIRAQQDEKAGKAKGGKA